MCVCVCNIVRRIWNVCRSLFAPPPPLHFCSSFVLPVPQSQTALSVCALVCALQFICTSHGGRGGKIRMTFFIRFYTTIWCGDGFYVTTTIQRGSRAHVRKKNIKVGPFFNNFYQPGSGRQRERVKEGATVVEKEKREIRRERENREKHREREREKGATSDFTDQHNNIS